MMLSQLTSLDIVSKYVPEFVHVFPLGDVKVSYTVSANEKELLYLTVRFTVMMLSQLASFGMVSKYVLVVVQVFPLGEV
jgi:hypothetical protein